MFKSSTITTRPTGTPSTFGGEVSAQAGKSFNYEIEDEDEMELLRNIRLDIKSIFEIDCLVFRRKQEPQFLLNASSPPLSMSFHEILTSMVLET